MPKNQDLILSLLNEVRTDQKSHSKILVAMKSDVRRNTDDLVEHMAQTRAVRELTVTHRDEANARLDKLEEPRKVFILLKKYLLGTGAIVGSILGILRLLNYI